MDRANQQIARIRNQLSDTVGTLLVSRVGEAHPLFGLEQHISRIGPVLTTRFRGVKLERRLWSLRPQWGPYVFLNIQKSGTTMCQEDGRCFSSSKGDIVLVDPCLASSVESFDTSAFVSIAIPRWTISSLEADGLQPLQNVLRGDLPSTTLLRETLEAMLKWGGEGSEGVANAAFRFIRELLAEAITEQQCERQTTELLLMRRMEAWVEQRILSGGVNVEMLARTFALSDRSLYRFFARQGTTPNRWLWDQRLNAAKDLLASPHVSVTTVAFDTGFKSISHFSRSFRTAFGVSPARYQHQTLQQAAS